MSKPAESRALGESGLSFREVFSARERIAPYVRQTPLIRADYLSELTGGDIYLKLESLQRLNSFKIRGMANRILNMSREERDRGVLVVSSGNHGIAASFCGRLWGIPAEVYVPATTPSTKIDRIKQYGAEVHLVGNDYDGAARALKQDMLSCDKGVYVDSSNDPMVVAGYGSVALEIVDELPDLDQILVPIGGGGLIIGIGLGAKAANPSLEVIGVQTEACPAMVVSLAEGKCYEEYPSESSICEALIGGIGRLPYENAPRCIDKVVTTSETAILDAVKSLIRYDKVVPEPSAAVGIAYILENPLEFHGKKVAVVISGGNIALDVLIASVM